VREKFWEIFFYLVDIQYICPNKIKKDMAIKKIRMDIAYNGPTNQTQEFMGFLQEVCEVFSLEIVGLIPVGPGGAWPEVAFRGEEKDILEFVQKFLDDKEVGLDYFYSYAEDDSYPEFNGPFVDERYTTKGERKYIDEDSRDFL
jgi:hypothetical protein